MYFTEEDNQKFRTLLNDIAARNKGAITYAETPVELSTAMSIHSNYEERTIPRRVPFNEACASPYILLRHYLQLCSMYSIDRRASPEDSPVAERLHSQLPHVEQALANLSKLISEEVVEFGAWNTALELQSAGEYDELHALEKEMFLPMVICVAAQAGGPTLRRTAELLGKAGDDVSVGDVRCDERNAMHIACILGKHDAVQTLAQAAVSSVHAVDGLGLTPLEYAVQFDSVRCVECLVRNGADVECHPLLHTTALHTSCLHAQLSITAALLNESMKKPIDANRVDEKGRTALHLLCLSTSSNADDIVSIARMLLDCGMADVNAVDVDLCTPLHYSAMHLHAGGPLTRFLIEHGGNVEARDARQNTPLHLACGSCGEFTDAVSVLLSAGADLSARNTELSTPLHCAANALSPFGHSREIVAALVEAGASKAWRDFRGRIPLHLAATSGNEAVVAELLAHVRPPKEKKVYFHYGGEENIETLSSPPKRKGETFDEVPTTQVVTSDMDGHTPLHLAAAEGHLPVIRRLLLHDTKHLINTINPITKRTPVHYAAQSGHNEVILFLIENKADADQVDVDGMTPLHCAVQAGCSGAVETLLSADARLNRPDLHRMTPLLFAVVLRRLQEVQVLLSHRPDVNCSDEDGRSALHHAARDPLVPLTLVEAIVSCGAKVNMVDYDKVTPLHFAAQAGRLEVAALLIRCGADVSRTEKSGRTALHLAVDSNRAETAAFLLSAGSDVNKAFCIFKTALHIAVANNNVMIAALLLDNGALVDGVDPLNVSPLVSAVELGCEELVRLLVGRGASVNRRDNRGRTPLFTAMMHHVFGLAQFLLDNGADAQSTEGVTGKSTVLVAMEEGAPQSLIIALIGCGASVDAPDDSGCTARSYAEKNSLMIDLR